MVHSLPVGNSDVNQLWYHWLAICSRPFVLCDTNQIVMPGTMDMEEKCINHHNRHCLIRCRIVKRIERKKKKLQIMEAQ
jgi:hypothetical protein